MNPIGKFSFVGIILLFVSFICCCERTSSPSATQQESKPPMNKLRILCLHGYHGSADTLHDQMSSLTEGLESLAEFVHVDAPSLSSGDFGWWHAVQNEEGSERGDPGVGPGRKYYKGWPRTRDWIVSLFHQQHFDGVFGFSQGAALTGLLVGLRAPDGKPTEEKPLTFDFAMMVSGYRSNDPGLVGLYASRESYSLPSVHLIGRSDFIVPPGESRALASPFTNPLILEHDGGHVVASTPDVRAQVRRFLEERLKARASRQTQPGAQGNPGAGPPIEVPLWEEGSSSSMKVVFPEGTSPGPRPAMVVFQGGAYSSNAGSGSGSAEWAAKHGMVGIQVRYGTRATRQFYPENYADAARAVRLVRHRAAEWGIDPARVAVMGFSAGGHLASLLSTQPTLWKDPRDALVDTVSARPDLVVLAYPVISFVDGYTPGAFVSSAENFLGRRDLSESLRQQFSNELHVDEQHPPVFLWTTRDDALVPYTHAELFAKACERADVPVAFTLYPHGPHGMGLALDQPGEIGEWTTHLLQWLDEHWSTR